MTDKPKDPRIQDGREYTKLSAREMQVWIALSIVSGGPVESEIRELSMNAKLKLLAASCKSAENFALIMTTAEHASMEVVAYLKHLGAAETFNAKDMH